MKSMKIDWFGQCRVTASLQMASNCHTHKHTPAQTNQHKTFFSRKFTTPFEQRSLRTWNLLIWIRWASMFICGTVKHQARLLYTLLREPNRVMRASSGQNRCLRSDVVQWRYHHLLYIKSSKPLPASSEQWSRLKAISIHCWPMSMFQILNALTIALCSSPACWVGMWNVALKLSWKSCRWSIIATNKSIDDFIYRLNHRHLQPFHTIRHFEQWEIVTNMPMHTSTDWPGERIECVAIKFNQYYKFVSPRIFFSNKLFEYKNDESLHSITLFLVRRV